MTRDVTIPLYSAHKIEKEFQFQTLPKWRKWTALEFFFFFTRVQTEESLPKRKSHWKLRELVKVKKETEITDNLLLKYLRRNPTIKAAIERDKQVQLDSHDSTKLSTLKLCRPGGMKFLYVSAMFFSCYIFYC